MSNHMNKSTSALANKVDTLDLREFGRTLNRQKKAIAIIFIFVVLLALLASLLSAPTYRATATVQVERETTKVIDVDFLNPGDIRDTRDFYQTQFELIKSQTLIERVIDKLQLDGSAIRRSIPARIKGIFSSQTETSKSELVLSLIDNLTIEPIKNSRLVNVHFDGVSPESSANITNAIVSSFVDMNLERRFETTNYTQEFLTKSIQDAKVKLQESEKKLNTYARENGIIQLDDKESTTSSFTIKRLSEELVKAEAAVIFEQTDPKSNSSRLASAKKRAELLRDELQREQAKALDLQDRTVTFKTLQREVETNQALYQGLLQRLKEIDVAGGVGTNNIFVTDRATAPLSKHKPNILMNLIFAGLLGSFLGVATAFFREFMDDSVKDINDLERQAGLPMLGLIPSARVDDPRRLAQIALAEPRSAVAEAFRTLRTSIQIRLNKKTGPSTVLITSIRANEGKTSVAMNLASTYAKTGSRVLLIDTDLRNPSIHKLFKSNNGKGLVGYLTGELTMDQLPQAVNVDNLSIITAGQPPYDPAELLSNENMQKLLAEADANYDLVILDGPPILGLADTLILASLVNITLLTIHANSTRMANVVHGLRRLEQAGCEISGMVLNQVADTSRFGYDDDYYNYPIRQR